MAHVVWHHKLLTCYRTDAGKKKSMFWEQTVMCGVLGPVCVVAAFFLCVCFLLYPSPVVPFSRFPGFFLWYPTLSSFCFGCVRCTLLDPFRCRRTGTSTPGRTSSSRENASPGRCVLIVYDLYGRCDLHDWCIKRVRCVVLCSMPYDTWIVLSVSFVWNVWCVWSVWCGFMTARGVFTKLKLSLLTGTFFVYLLFPWFSGEVLLLQRQWPTWWSVLRPQCAYGVPRRYMKSPLSVFPA